MVTSIGVTKYAYDSILSFESAKFSYQDDFLSVGDHHFTIKARNICIGEISFSLRKEKATYGKAQGKISASVSDSPIDVHIDGNFYFNPLGQMSDLHFGLTSEGLKASVTTSEIHPIKLEAEAVFNDKTRKFNKEIPGPVIIKEISEGKFQLQYDQEMPISPVALKAPAAFLQSELNLQILQKTTKDDCKDQGRIDLTRLISQIKGKEAPKEVGSL